MAAIGNKHITEILCLLMAASTFSALAGAVPARPTRSNVIGAFTFNAGTDGFVESHTANSTGLVVADAIELRRVPQPPTPQAMAR
jgi:hypothetical protein